MTTVGFDGAHQRAVDRWFVRRGVPHFIADYTATGDVFTRAAGLLTLIFLVEIGSAVNFRFTWWQNVLAFLGAVGIVIVALAVVNELRGRPRWQRPDTIGPVELAAFLVVPALIPLVIGDQWHQTLGIFGANLGFLVVVYAATSYGLLPILRWAVVQAGRQLRDIANLMTKSLPLLLLFSMFTFVNADMWKVSAEIPWPFLLIAVAMLVAVGSAFVLLRVPQELAQMGRFDSWAAVTEQLGRTPLAGVAAPATELASPPLSRRERANVGLVLFFSQAVQVLLVSVAIGAFYLAFGLFVMQRATMRLWIGHAPRVYGSSPHFLGADVFLSRELLVTAIFVAAVSGLQFAIAAITDTTYRTEFLARITGDLRTAFAVRALYRASV